MLNYCVMPQNWQEFGRFLLEADEADLDVHAIPVTAPDAFDLQKLPDGELRSIVAALELEGSALEPMLGRNADVWRTQMSRLQRTLEQGASPGRHPAGDGPVLDLDVLRSKVRPQPDSALLEVELASGVVCAVTSPPWADTMFDTTGWIGVGVHDLPARLADDLGLGFPEIRLDDRDEGTVDATLRFPGDTKTTVLRAMTVEAFDGRPARLLLAEPTVDES